MVEQQVQQQLHCRPSRPDKFILQRLFTYIIFYVPLITPSLLLKSRKLHSVFLFNVQFFRRLVSYVYTSCFLSDPSDRSIRSTLEHFCN